MSINKDPSPGDYLIRRADDALAQPEIEYIPPVEPSAYKVAISYATTYGIMLGRSPVRQNNTDNIATIRNYEDQTFLGTIPRTLSQSFAAQAPRLSRDLIDFERHEQSHGLSRPSGQHWTAQLTRRICRPV
jgi:hypothetical protein